MQEAQTKLKAHSDGQSHAGHPIGLQLLLPQHAPSCASPRLLPLLASNASQTAGVAQQVGHEASGNRAPDLRNLDILFDAQTRFGGESGRSVLCRRTARSNSRAVSPACVARTATLRKTAP